ncbi:MAG: tail fiber domain-containing protein, partial [Patescibacteria group bacterium]
NVPAGSCFMVNGACLVSSVAGIYFPLSGGTMNAGSTITFNGNGNYGVGVGSAGPNKNSIAVDTLETDPGGTFELNYYGGGEVHVGSGGSKALRASIIYDGNNGGYYIDMNNTSQFNYLGRNYGWNWTEYDWNNGAYYMDLDQTSRVNALYANTFIYGSDESLKKDVKTIPYALKKVLKLRGVEFNWKEGDTPSVGLIAQEVEKVFPELVHVEPQSGLKAVEYGNLIAPLIEAVKELKAENDDLRTRVEKLEAKN